jgi:hypothetical protein
MHVPAHLQAITRQLALQSWVASSSFPLDEYCETIDELKGPLGRHAPHDEDDPPQEAPREVLVVLLAAVLDREGLLITHVLATGTYSPDDEERWHRTCLAAAWVVLQAYERECKAGRWPRP